MSGSVFADSSFQGYTKNLETGDKFRINISAVYYYVTADEVTNTSAKINVTGGYDQIEFDIGDSKNFDVDGDGDYDISVTLNSINTTTSEANVKVQTYVAPAEKEDITETEEIEEVVTEEDVLGEEEAVGFPTWATLAIVAVVLAIGYFWFFYDKGSKTKK